MFKSYLNYVEKLVLCFYRIHTWAFRSMLYP